MVSIVYGRRSRLRGRRFEPKFRYSSLLQLRPRDSDLKSPSPFVLDQVSFLSLVVLSLILILWMFFGVSVDYGFASSPSVQLTRVQCDTTTRNLDSCTSPV